MKRFSLRTVETFVTVAETGGITQAAARMGRSQASISATISEFEEKLGFQLFVRKAAKGLVLTQAGHVIVLEARGLLAHADEFETIAGALGNPLEGNISVGCFTNLAPILFANLLARFSVEYPKIRVELHVGDQREVLEGLQSGVTELALTFDLAISDRFHKLPLATLPPYALVPAHHRLANSSHVRLAELADEQFILMDLPHTREYFLSLFYSQHLEPHVHFRATSFETVRTLVGNGLGFSLLNLLPKHSLTYDGTEVVSLPISDPLLPLQIVLLTMKRVARRRIASSFQDFARSYLKTWREENSINPAVL